MRITDHVDLPEALIAGAATGELVLFVGAGVSMNAPSDLPSFTGLTRQLAEEQGVAVDADLEPDAFLGRLCDADPTVRERARAIIANPNSQPNDTHRAIVRLSKACGAIRIVSTNYDEHLSAAAAELSVQIGDVYHGPAVPLGRNFNGLVYLHGQVSRAPSELVLTDDDFGRAYLIDGWARRFVTDLFLNRTVLFIGYSHNDAVMKYLARALPPTTQRFALTDTPDDLKWRDLRISPIQYPNDNDHAAATIALNEWARRLEMGHLDHRARVHEIVRGGPPKLPVEADFIAASLSLPAGVRAFSEAADGEEWLRWAEQQPVFLSLFTAGDEPNDAGQVLAHWFADKYVSDIEMSGKALATLARLGPVVCAPLRQSIAYAAYKLRETSPELALKWSIVAAAALRTHGENPEETWNVHHRSAIRGHKALPLLRRALHPRLMLSIDRPWFPVEEVPRERVKFNVAWSSSESDLQQLWDAASEGFPKIAPAALQIFEQSLLDGYELLAIFDSDQSWDGWSYGRSAIEPHEQDRFPDYESTLIDALRDTSVMLAESDGSILERWLGSEFGLFRRLGLHLLTEQQAMSAHDKLVYLLSGSHLYDHRSKHEVFRLLGTIAPDLDDADRRSLLAQALEGPPPFDVDPETETRLHERCIFDVLEWLSRYVAGWDELTQALARIREGRPDIEVRDHADFDHWMESGTWTDEMPFTSDEFIQEFETHGLTAALGLAVNRTYSDISFDGPTWRSACSSVQRAVESRPEIGLAVLGEQIAAPDPTWEGDLKAAAIAGLSKARLTEQQIRRALEFLPSLAVDPRLARPISELCLSAVGDDAPEYSDPLVDQLDDLAAAVWAAQARNTEMKEEGSEDWLMLGLNTWPGILALYWLHRIRLRWRAEEDDWRGLTTAEKDTGTRLLDPSNDATRASLAILAADVYFLFRADPTFARDQVFPIFETNKGALAMQAWKSYLHHPRATDAMLDAGFWHLLTSARDLIANLDSPHGTERQYWWRLASICVSSDAETVDAVALLTQLTDPNELSSFISAISDALHEIDEAESMAAWNDWLAELIRLRLTGSPITTTAQERTAWGDLALRLRSGLTLEALELTDNAPGPLGRESTFRDLPSDVIGAQPDTIARIISRRIAQTGQADWHIQHELETLVLALREVGVSNQALQNLAECAMQIGYYDASSWVSPQGRDEQ